jgi:hypothetical protein
MSGPDLQLRTKTRWTFTLGFFLSLISLSALHAQTPPSQAPDEATRKITELVHAGRYAEAQQLTSGLLLAYPDDARLIKGHVLLEQLLSPTAANAAAATSNTAPQPSASVSTETLTGMDRIDYNALIALAKQAQQTTDLPEQNNLLQQFMDESASFVQKHSGQMLLWQLRAASAISLNDPLSGYQAGEKLIAAGAADSDDAGAQRILTQLKNKGWLDQRQAAKQSEVLKNYTWILGTWSAHYTWSDSKGRELQNGDYSEEFSKADSIIECYVIDANGKKNLDSNLRGTILDSGEIKWERRLNSDWKPASFEISDDKRTMKLVVSENRGSPANAFGHVAVKENIYTGTYTKK